MDQKAFLVQKPNVIIETRERGHIKKEEKSETHVHLGTRPLFSAQTHSCISSIFILTQAISLPSLSLFLSKEVKLMNLKADFTFFL